MVSFILFMASSRTSGGKIGIFELVFRDREVGDVQHVVPHDTGIHTDRRLKCRRCCFGLGLVVATLTHTFTPSAIGCGLIVLGAIVRRHPATAAVHASPRWQCHDEVEEERDDVMAPVPRISGFGAGSIAEGLNGCLLVYGLLASPVLLEQASAAFFLQTAFDGSSAGAGGAAGLGDVKRLSQQALKALNDLGAVARLAARSLAGQMQDAAAVDGGFELAEDAGTMRFVQAGRPAARRTSIPPASPYG